MLTEQQAASIMGGTAYASDGEKIGKIGQVYLDDESGQPEFVTVNTGLFGTSESFVPVADATVTGDGVTLPYTKDKVKDAPNVDTSGDGHLDRDQEQRLYEYYGRSYSSYGGTDTTTETTTGRAYGSGNEAYTETTSDGSRGEGYDVSGPETDDAMTLSEERVRVGTASEETGRVRLRKYVTTETETHSVPVRKERAVLEREPITEDNIGDATSGPDISEEEHELTLSEERVVVQKEATPVERVRLGKETVTDEATVTEEVRKEQLDTDGLEDVGTTSTTGTSGSSDRL